MNTNDSAAPSDSFDLSRFVQAQQGVYTQALSELQRGRKASHWMWFIFPQIKGLGSSPMAERYAIKNQDEARAYLKHSILGARLSECCEALLHHHDLTASQIFGYPDDMKLRSSMTLFALVAGDDSVFKRVLDRYFDGQPDGKTLDLVDFKQF